MWGKRRHGREKSVGETVRTAGWVSWPKKKGAMANAHRSLVTWEKNYRNQQKLLENLAQNICIIQIFFVPLHYNLGLSILLFVDGQKGSVHPPASVMLNGMVGCISPWLA